MNGHPFAPIRTSGRASAKHDDGGRRRLLEMLSDSEREILGLPVIPPPPEVPSWVALGDGSMRDPRRRRSVESELRTFERA